MRTLLPLLAAALFAACGGSSDAPPAAGEPNDTIAQATAATLPGTVAGAIATADDVDFYAITVPAGGASVRLQTFDSTGATCDPGRNAVDPFLAVFAADGTLLGANDDGGLAPFCEDLTLAMPAGVAYVMVGGYAPVPFNYTLKLSIVP